MTPHFISAISGTVVSFFGITASVFAANTFTPLPSELVTLSLGYITSVYGIPPLLAVLAGLTASMIGDVGIYLFTSRVNRSVRFIERLVKKDVLERFRTRMREHTGKTVFFLRFFPGPNIISPILAGTLHIPFKKYFKYDLAAGAIFTVVFVALGDVFHASIESVTKEIGEVKHVIIVVAVFLAGLVLSWYVYRRFLRPVMRDLTGSVKELFLKDGEGQDAAPGQERKGE